ncbi:hypothetical protein FRB97_002200, partial [Tulasnella sp. 331]
MQKGDIPGHECMGVIDRIEKSVTKLSVGDRVVTSFQVACGKCVYCKKILSSFCEKTNDSMFVGDQCQRLKIPDRIARLMGFRRRCMGSGTRDSSVTLISPAATLVDRPNMFENLGLGPTGMSAARWCQPRRAKRIIGIESVPSRLKMAEERLGIETIKIKEQTDVVKRIYEMVPMGLDVALECDPKKPMPETDNPETINEAILATKKMGRIGVIAAYAGLANDINIGAIMEC